MNQPTPPSNAISMVTYNPSNLEDGTSYVLEIGQTLEADINFANNVNYYIQGDLTISDIYGSSGTMYILEDGDVSYEKTSLGTGHNIENYGELQLPSNFTIEQGASLMVSTYFNLEGSLNVDGTLYCADSTDIGAFTLNNSGDAYFEYNLRVNNTITLNQGELYVNQYLKANSLIINDAVNFDFNGPTLLSCSVIDIKTTLASIDNIGDQYSVIECDELIIRNKNQKQFKGWIDIHAEEIDNRTSDEIQWLSGVLFNGSAYISETDYNPAFGEPSTEITYGLNHIAEVDPHEQNISATSIDFKDGNAYVSWHLVEAPLKGILT